MRQVEARLGNPDAAIEAVLAWARTRQDIRGMALVGSRARGTARENSDIDLVLLVDSPEEFRSDAKWLGAIPWRVIGSHDTNWDDEDYGVVWSRRIYVAGDLEVEISFAPVSWAAVAPLDAGTRKVISDGCRILFDPDGYFRRLAEAIAQQIG